MSPESDAGEVGEAGAVAQYGAEGLLTLWSSTQITHYVHRALAQVL